jgi:hypothetical protein
MASRTSRIATNSKPIAISGCENISQIIIPTMTGGAEKMIKALIRRKISSSSLSKSRPSSVRT